MKITGLLRKPGGQWKIHRVSNSLGSLQALVEGDIEIISIARDLVIICNEEGKCLDLKPTMKLFGDILVGNVFLCRVDDEGFVSLPDPEGTLGYLQRAESRATMQKSPRSGNSTGDFYNRKNIYDI